MRSYILVATGGSLGASLRWSVDELIGQRTGSFPFATLFVNIVGCALAGLAARYLLRGSGRWQLGVTGFLGGLTTYSTFASETRRLLDTGHAGQALLYVALTIVGGMMAIEIARGDWSRS